MTELLKVNETYRVELDKESTFEEIITLLEKAHGKKIRNALLEAGKDCPQGHVIVFINGNQINNAKAKIIEVSNSFIFKDLGDRKIFIMPAKDATASKLVKNNSK